MRLVLRNIRSFIKGEQMIFLLLILCIVTSSVILNFSYGLYQNFHILKTEESTDMAAMPMTLRGDITKAEVERYMLSLSSDTNDSIISWSMVFTYNGDSYHCFVTIRHGKITVSEMDADGFRRLYITDGEYFSASQIEKGDYVALIPDEKHLESGKKNRYPVVDNKVNIMGKNYEVIGTLKGFDAPMIPFTTMDGDMVLSDFTLFFSSSVKRSQYNDILSNAENIFGDRLHVPRLKIKDNQQLYLYNTVMFIAAAISVIAAANFVVLYRYILIKRRKIIAIYRICGCTRFKAVRSYIGECLMLIIPMYLAAALGFNYGLLPVFSTVYTYMQGAFSLKIYTAIFGIYLTISLVSLILMIVREVGKTPVSAVKGGA